MPPRIATNAHGTAREIVGFADGNVARRQVNEHGRARECGGDARRDRRPHVIADFRRGRLCPHLRRPQEDVGSERRFAPGEAQVDGAAPSPEATAFHRTRGSSADTSSRAAARALTVPDKLLTARCWSREKPFGNKQQPRT
jgi:hypothetical protein